GSPLYCAVSEWLPTASEEIVKLAMPAASVPVPICTPPSNKLADPVGESPVTFTANFTGCPKLAGFCDDDSPVVVTTSPLVNRSPEVMALVPPAVVTVTSTVPTPVGEVAVIWVALSTVKEPAALLPNLTAVAPEKLVPVMVTLLPPDV